MRLEFTARGRSTIIGWVQGQAQVGAGSFEVIRDSESATENRVAACPSGCIRETKARLEVLAAIHAVVKRSAVAILARVFNLARLNVVVRLLIVYLNPWSMRFITQPVSEGQVVRYAPGILRKSTNDVGSLFPSGAAAQAAPKCCR